MTILVDDTPMNINGAVFTCRRQADAERESEQVATVLRE